MILLWDVDSGLAQLDKYFHSTDNHVIAGALLGVGIVNCGVKNDCDPVSPSRNSLSAEHFLNNALNYDLPFLQALALLGDYIDKEDPAIRIGAIMGLGIAYANTQNEQVCSMRVHILSLMIEMECTLYFNCFLLCSSRILISF